MSDSRSALLLRLTGLFLERRLARRSHSTRARRGAERGRRGRSGSPELRDRPRAGRALLGQVVQGQRRVLRGETTSNRVRRPFECLTDFRSPVETEAALTDPGVPRRGRLR